MYLPFHVRPRELEPAVRAIRALGLHGLNVTIPHKETIVPFMDRLSPEARVCGAVNTIEVSGGGSSRKLIGHNTDGLGFLAAYHEQVAGRAGGQAKSRVAGRQAILLGAGGAARAIAAGLAREGIGRLVLVNRTVARAEALRTDLSRSFRRLSLDILPLHRLASETTAPDIFINATPLGMTGHPPLPLPRALLRKEKARRIVVCDVVYAPDITPLLRAARAAGAMTVNGAVMLLHQAALAFEIWTRHRAPLAAMRAALPIAHRRNTHE